MTDDIALTDVNLYIIAPTVVIPKKVTVTLRGSTGIKNPTLSGNMTADHLCPKKQKFDFLKDRTKRSIITDITDAFTTFGNKMVDIGHTAAKKIVTAVHEFTSNDELKKLTDLFQIELWRYCTLAKDGSPPAQQNNGKQGGNFVLITQNLRNPQNLNLVSIGGNGGQGANGGNNDIYHTFLRNDSAGLVLKYVTELYIGFGGNGAKGG